MARGKKNGAEPEPEGDGEESGTNFKVTKKAVKEFADRYNNILDDLETYRGERMSECKELIEEAANALGCKRKVIRIALGDQRREKKRRESEKEMEPSERDQLDTIRSKLSVLADTPLGQAALERVEAGT